MNEFLLSLLLTGALSTGPTLPFWMTANQFGLMPEHSGALALVQAGTQYDPAKDFQWKWGASLAANLDKGPTADFNLMVDELYASLKWRALSLDLGMRHDPLDFYGAAATLGSLSTTGGHLIASGNARSMPGYMLRLDPVPVPFTGKHVWLYGAFGDFKTLDKRYVQGALVHRTQLFVKVSVSRLDFDFGIDHYAIWAGQNPKVAMPATFANYFRVITGRSASASGSHSDQLNVIGDQGGGELFRLSWRGDGWHAILQHDIPYNDGSGMAFLNFPDGVNTLCVGFDRKNHWVSDVAYEFMYTRNQSGWSHKRPVPDQLQPSGGDNYFNNEEYRSGWTHFGHPIGFPLFVPKGTHAGTWTGWNIVLGIENNRLRAHHIGVSGMLFHQFPYKLMLTFSQNYGLYKKPYLGESPWNKEPGTVKETALHQVSGAFVGEVPVLLYNRHGFTITYGIYADRGQLLPDQFGFSLGLRYELGR